MRMHELVEGQHVEGLEPKLVVTLDTVKEQGPDAVRVVYVLPDGTPRLRVIGAAEAELLRIATDACPWSFAADGEAFQLAAEALRLDLAHLFDPMLAVHTSNVEPLPHQIAAVYASLLPRQPLRFVLADDPGAGKTVMAGLYMRELLLRADAERILVVAPGSLVEQWRDELFEKFGLTFRVYDRALDHASPSGDAFRDHTLLIARLDQLARNDDARARATAAAWDLVVADEAHKMSAHWSGDSVKPTQRFELGRELGAATRHLLLMTATPHNGNEADFQLFLSLLDSDRFYGRFRDGVHVVDVSDVMRRCVKEDLVTFAGTPLFPERRAYTVNYVLSAAEAELYTAVTDYVRTQMGKADTLDGQRKGAVGFALTTLQRRLASSPEAIYQSLRRRRERLEARVQEERALGRSKGPATLAQLTEDFDDEDLDAETLEGLEDTVVDHASAATTIAELQAEIATLAALQAAAHAIVLSGQDRKWEELSRTLQSDPRMTDAGGKPRKLIVFTEHRDTLVYLERRIGDLIGLPDAVLTIHGGTVREARKEAQARFRSDPGVRVLIATDAAGEGVNLQVANLMVNYDLPWNPNRLEQRFGRIHRIGQREVCHLWNLVASETREGAVYHRLLQKLEVEGAALKGRVFDILGEVFEGVNLRDLMIEAIRAGETDEVRARLHRQVDSIFDRTHLQDILDRNALAQESMTPERLYAVREDMEKAEARRLQPRFVRAWFLRAFRMLGGSVHDREAGRFEITHVPRALRDRDRRISGRNRRDTTPVLDVYERVCFEKAAVRPNAPAGAVPAVLLHPGHPLLLAATDLMLEQHSDTLRQGAVLVDPLDDGDTPSMVFGFTHAVSDDRGRTLSKRMGFVRVRPDGTATHAGSAPHLELDPLGDDDRARVRHLLEAPWLRGDLQARAAAVATSMWALAHAAEVRSRRTAQVDRTLEAVHERLTKEIAFWQDRWRKLRDDAKAGKDVRLPFENARRKVTELQERLERRREELEAMRHVASGAPVVAGAILVVPAGLLARLRDDAPATPPDVAADAAARAKTEALAMAAVMAHEAAQARAVKDVSADKCGWDVTSTQLDDAGRVVDVRHIEVKGRIRGASTVTVTTNEVREGLNQGDLFRLAIVVVDHEHTHVDGVWYLARPFTKEPDWGVASWNFDLATLIARAEKVA
jgi:superfamily II DNA or RNA helicase